jgi:hypothetical protein
MQFQYMDLSEFIHLLYSKSLFFCNTKKFGDPFEGSLPLLNNILNEQKEYQITKKLLENKKKFKNVIKSQPITKMELSRLEKQSTCKLLAYE